MVVDHFEEEHFYWKYGGTLDIPISPTMKITDIQVEFQAIEPQVNPNA